jgi:uncharacterized coiled-coil protein SlyX
MTKSSLFRAMVASAMVLGFSGAAHAQTESQKPGQPAQEKKPAAKVRKVWTEDDVSSLRSPADDYREKKEAQDEAAAKQAASGQQTLSKKPELPSHPPKSLSNPKTVEEADGMIAWEKRDVDAQQEDVERLQKELNEAPADRKERLQALIVEHQRILADTRKEMLGLVEQKKGLEKKSSSANSASSAKPPSP